MTRETARRRKADADESKGSPPNRCGVVTHIMAPTFVRRGHRTWRDPLLRVDSCASGHVGLLRGHRQRREPQCGMGSAVTMRQVVLTVSVVLLATVAASYWFFFRWSTYEVSWDPPPHVGADGRTIRLSYVGRSPTGDCRTEGRISVHEGQDRVVLTVTVAELRFTGGCNGAGYRRIAVAHLDQALGQRKLVDGHKF